ncbi:MAG: hypothetical protein NTX13_15345, partial [Acidobacteria bacterium]|nr:hypothetical protein [Acidobacteriota bacterium]
GGCSNTSAPGHNNPIGQSFDVTFDLLFRHSCGVLSKLLFGDVVDWPNVELSEASPLCAVPQK